MTYTLAFLQNLGMPEMIVIGVVALLIFGRRLPEVGRSVGRSIVEFKKGLKETESDVKDISGGGKNDKEPESKSTDFNDPQDKSS